MTPADFDDPTAAGRIRAAETFLHTPTQALVDAFCVRWTSPTNLCPDVMYDAATQPDDALYAAMAARDDINAAYTAAIKRLRAHPQGVSFVLSGYGNGGERCRTACLKGLPTSDLVTTLEAFATTDHERALQAIGGVLAILSSTHEHRPALEALLATLGAPAPKKKKKKKKKKKTAPKKATGPLQAAMDGLGNLDAATAKALLADPPTRAKGKKLAERLQFRTDTDDVEGAFRTLEVAWAAHSSKGPRNPGQRTARMGLELAAQQGELGPIVVWLDRLKAAASPTVYRETFESGELAAFALHDEIRARFTPKLPASSKAMHPTLLEHLLPTLTLREGRRLHAAATCSAVGTPWLPGPWPRDTTGIPMLFLAQLNFAELPTLPGFPDHGLLLLFVPNNNTLGLGFSDQKSEYAAVFLPDPEADAAHNKNHTEAKDFEGGHRKGPLTSKHTALQWKLHLQSPIPQDRRFEALAGADALKPKARQQLHDKQKNPQGFGGNHRLGGYAEFVQGEDPRRGDTAGFVHLLSLDSYEPWGFMFGDGGLAHFFIDPDDLAASRFDRMLWFWDCA